MKKLVFLMLIFSISMHDFSYLNAGNGAGWGFLGGFGAGALTTLAVSKSRDGRREREVRYESPRYIQVSSPNNQELQQLRAQVEAQNKELQKLRTESQQTELTRMREKYKKQKKLLKTQEIENLKSSKEASLDNLGKTGGSDNFQATKAELQEKLAQIEEIEARQAKGE